jgi:sulfur-oxidizing protein SoxB
MGTFDQLIVEAIKDTYDPEIVFSPGYRWGTTLLPGDTITMKDVYDHTSITYPNVWTFDMRGEQLWMIFEDILDNLFNPDPYQQQGGDFSRLLGVEMIVKINAPLLKRIPIESIKIDGKPFNPKKLYKISAWGGNLYRAGTNLRPGARPVYDVVRDYLKKKKKVRIEANSGIKYHA